MYPSSSPPVFPSFNEDLFITDVINFNLKNNAEQPFYIYADPKGTNGLSTITHLEFGRAAHRVAHVVRPEGTGAEGKVVALIALSDSIIYQAVVVGLIIAGYVPFPISPRNSPTAIVNLLEKTSCHRLITTSITLEPLINGIKSYIANTPLAETLEIEEVPSFSSIYPNLARETPDHSFERYPAIKRPSRDDVCVYIHSSGSTGLPKAIPQTHLAWTQWASSAGLSDFRDYKTRAVVACMSLPPFHTLGLFLQVVDTLYGIMPVTMYPPTATAPELLPLIPSPENILEHAKLTKANMIIIPPSTLQTWCQIPTAVNYLSTLEYVFYAGGSLAPKLGNRLVESGVKIYPIYGSTETGSPTHIMASTGDKRDWEYMSFHERVKVRWAPQGDGTFECQFLAWEKHMPMVSNLKDVKGFATSDLWKQHPTKKHLWKIIGRIDDVIVHSSGEKTVPTPLEDVILSSPLIQGAVMFGRERDQTGILIEPRPGNYIDVNDHEEIAELRSKLWPVVEEANKLAPAFSRIFKEMILITSQDKPLLRAGKGTVLRKLALALYEQEINEFQVSRHHKALGFQLLGLTHVENWIREQANDLTPSTIEISPAQDLFEQGFDSLSATFLRLRILGILRLSGIPELQKIVLPQNLIYSYPIIKDLASHIVTYYIFPGDSQGAAATASGGRDQMEALIENFTAGFQNTALNSNLLQTRSSSPVVLLTGSTGNLGSEILSILSKDDHVEKVYVLNRPGSQTIFERHLKRFSDKGLDADLLNKEKLVFVSGDITQPDLGLDRGQYSQICRSVNVVIHNAWKLDFNLSLSSFEPHIRGTRHLIDLIKSGPSASDARFVFTSSVASAQSWDKSRGPVPEEIVADASIAVGAGYGESKYVAERILAESGLRATSVRIGQISGGLPNGAWVTTDWVPILVKSSIKLGVLPMAEGVVSWLPMDKTAATMVNVALSNDVAPSPMLNLVHPRPTRWSEVITSIQSAIKQVLGHDLGFVTFDEWILAIEAHASNSTTKTLEAIPAIKLLNFFRAFAQGSDTAEIGGLATYSTSKIVVIGGDALDASELPQITRKDAERWVKYWGGVDSWGFAEC